MTDNRVPGREAFWDSLRRQLNLWSGRLVVDKSPAWQFYELEIRGGIPIVLDPTKVGYKSHTRQNPVRERAHRKPFV